MSGCCCSYTQAAGSMQPLPCSKSCPLQSRLPQHPWLCDQPHSINPSRPATPLKLFSPWNSPTLAPPLKPLPETPPKLPETPPKALDLPHPDPTSCGPRPKACGWSRTWV